MLYSLTVTNTIGESLTFELSNPWASGYAIKQIDGLGTPDMNVNTTPYGIGDGSVLGSIKAEYRLITLMLWPLASPTVETARQRLYRFFQIKKDILLSFNTENRLVTIDGYVQKIEASIFDNPELITIEIKCINPYFHKMANDQTKFYGIQPMFEFPFSVEFDYEGGNEWTEDQLPTNQAWSLSAHGGGYSVVLNKTLGVGVYRKDGSNWEETSLPSDPSNPFVSYGELSYVNDRFMTGRNSSDKVGYSLTGKSWAYTTLPERYINPLCLFAFGLYLVLDTSSEFKACYSSDLEQWHKLEVPSISRLRSAIYENEKLIFLTDDKVYYTFSSPVFNEWNEKNLPTSLDWTSIVAGDNLFVAYNNKLDTAIYSTNLVDWYNFTLPFQDSNERLTYGDGYFLYLGAVSKRYTISTNLFDWVEQTPPSQTNVISVWLYGDGKVMGFSRDKVFYNTPLRIKDIDLIEFSQFTIDNRMEIDYQGEIDAGIKITIECRTPPGDIIIYNVDTLEYIQIFAERIEAVSGAPLGPKDIVEINTESGNKYVRLLRNGIYYNILGAMNRGMTWFTLKQGPNTFTYTTTDEHSAISMTFSYRDTYAAL